MAKTKKPTETEDTKRTSFILRTILSKKLNYMKVMGAGEITDMVDEALSDYIEKWEKKNGPIPLK